jgi:hypothetical protein
MVVSVNSNTAAGIVREAHNYKVPVIAYDRLIKNSDLDYFVTFEGAQIANLMVDHAVGIVPKGNYVLLPWNPTAGMVFRWFRDELGGGKSYQELETEATKVPPGADDLTVLPNFSEGGAFIGLTLAHTQAHIVRAIFESVAFMLRENIELLEKIGIEIKEIIVVKVIIPCFQKHHQIFLIGWFINYYKSFFSSCTNIIGNNNGIAILLEIVWKIKLTAKQTFLIEFKFRILDEKSA